MEGTIRFALQSSNMDNLVVRTAMSKPPLGYGVDSNQDTSKSIGLSSCQQGECHNYMATSQNVKPRWNPQADPYPRSIPKPKWSRPIHTSGSPRADPYPNFDATPYVYIYFEQNNAACCLCCWSTRLFCCTVGSWLKAFMLHGMYRCTTDMLGTCIVI